MRSDIYAAYSVMQQLCKHVKACCFASIKQIRFKQYKFTGL